jgi:superfamily II DNA or RNA helicase
MAEVLIKKVNETFIRVIAEKSILKEIESQFKYRPLNFRFDPNYINRIWDGYIKLFRADTKLFYIGILDSLVMFLQKQGYCFKISGDFAGTKQFSEHEARMFIKTLNLPSNLEVRDYQLKYFITSVRNRRAICVSPTNSGKSLLQYLLFRYFNKKTLIIVPNIQLVTQMSSDFKSYGYDGDIHEIMEGKEKDTDCQLIISTYQSIYKLPSSWYADKEVILGDEVHTFKAKSLKALMEKCTNSSVRIGVTGTFPDDILSQMTIKGLFGPIHTFISSKELIEQGYSTPLIIKILTLNHIDCCYWKNTSGIEYEDEIKFLMNSEARIKFIKNLSISLKGNTFIMFNEIKGCTDFPVYYVDGNTEVTERNKIISEVETQKNSITVCSSVFSTGINIKRLDNMIFARPSKSRIRIMQSIGRGLRKSPDKNKITLFDISDKIFRDIDNITLRHGLDRVKMYENENFDFKKYSINLEVTKM